MQGYSPDNDASSKLRDVVWVIGNGRSGTTWLADLVNYKKNYLELFEPFHPPLIKRASEFERFQYFRPNDVNDAFYGLARDIFTGRFRHPRVDSYRSGGVHQYSGLLIKDIFSNL